MASVHLGNFLKKCIKLFFADGKFKSHFMFVHEWKCMKECVRGQKGQNSEYLPTMRLMLCLQLRTYVSALNKCTSLSLQYTYL